MDEYFFFHVFMSIKVYFAIHNKKAILDLLVNIESEVNLVSGWKPSKMRAKPTISKTLGLKSVSIKLTGTKSQII